MTAPRSFFDGFWSSVLTSAKPHYIGQFAIDFWNMASPMFMGLPCMLQNLPLYRPIS
jgi:hypothetical protein